MEPQKLVVDRAGGKMIKTEVLECPLCNAKSAKPLFVKEGKSFVQCDGCGLVYQKEPPTAEESGEYYRKNYYQNFGSQIEKINEGRLSLYRDIFIQFSKGREKGRLLDIGCGYGDFLKLAEEKGWEGWGIEPSRDASETVRGSLGQRILNQTIETTDFPDRNFDVITLWNVIDCLPDPLGAMQRIYEWLSPGGLLIIRTPNVSFHLQVYRFYLRFRSLLEKVGWKKEASVFLKTNYERETLERLLGQAGFTQVRIENGALTSGDAYQVFSRSALAVLAKSFLYTIARFVGWVSGNKILIGSNLIACASKENAESKYSPRAIRSRLILKRIILHALAGLGYLLGLPVWLKCLGKDREIRILRYHSVSEFKTSDINVKESEFAKQMDFLKSHCTVISLEQAVDLMERGELPKAKSVALSFDDGYEDNYKVVYPILKARALTATVFLLTGAEGSERTVKHLQEDLPQHNRLLSWEQVREMTSGGIRFGSHGETHGRLIDLPPEQARLEMEESKNKIESHLSQPVPFFSYPYGTAADLDPRLKSLAREAGYRAAFSAISGSNGKRSERFALRRIGIEAADTPFTFRAKLNGALGLLGFFELAPVRRLVRRLDSFFLKNRQNKTRRESPLLLVSVDFPPHTDGVSTLSRELSARIATGGRRVMVIGPKDRGDREFDRSQPYRVFRIPGYEWGYLRFLPIMVWMPLIVWTHRIRQVLAMNIAYGGILSWGLSFLKRLEYLIFAYGYEFEKVKPYPFLRRFYLSIYRRSKAIVTCSELVKKRLIDFGVSPEKIHVLYPGVDLERFYPREVPQTFLEQRALTGKRILLTVGRIVERKGHDHIIKALPKIVGRFPDILYCIVGMGPYEQNLRNLVRELGLEDHVCFLGKVPDEELAFLYNACEIFLMLSREISKGGHIEGFGIVYLEANACGKPVIGGSSGGVLEAIRDGESGFLVDPHSPDAVREKIVELLSNPQKARILGAQGLHWVSQNFNWQNYVQKAYRLMADDDLKS